MYIYIYIYTHYDDNSTVQHKKMETCFANLFWLQLCPRMPRSWAAWISYRIYIGMQGPAPQDARTYVNKQLAGRWFDGEARNAQKYGNTTF